MKEALIRMVHVARKTMELDNMFMKLGYDNTPYFDIHGTIIDAIYHLIGERTNSLDESVTYQTIHDEDMTDDQRVEHLLASAKADTELTITVPTRTLSVIKEDAAKRTIDYRKLVNLILSEWAYNRECDKLNVNL